MKITNNTPNQPEADAIIVGSGPNGLAAAITLAETGCRVLVVEAKDTIGGGTRTAELTLPGYLHDICSAIHPMGVGSPFFRNLPLNQHGLEWIHPTLPLAHPFDDGTAAYLDQSISKTAYSLGEDKDAYQKLVTPFVRDWEKLMPTLLGPFRPWMSPILMTKFGLKAIQSASMLATSHFQGEKARGFFAGLAAHSLLPLEQITSAAIGLVLALLGHAVGWPLPRGGSQKIADAMACYLSTLNGEIVTGHPVRTLQDLPPSRVILFDLTPRQLVEIVGDALPVGYQRRLKRYRYGPGVCKVDWALSEPVPWQAEACHQAGTIHLGSTFAEIAASERAIWQREHHEKPYILVAQQSSFDDTRAPANKHTLWSYCHVPNGSEVDRSEQIAAQIERYAPGFRDCVLANHVKTATDYNQYNPNYIGGDINGGVQDWRQLFTRPIISLNPYATPNKRLFLCSSSTPPGGGVHGMCGYHAAQAAKKTLSAA